MLGSFIVNCESAQTGTENAKYDIKCGRKAQGTPYPLLRNTYNLQFGLDVVGFIVLAEIPPQSRRLWWENSPSET